MKNSCIPISRAEGGMMYSTRRSEPNPPVMPMKGVQLNASEREKRRQTLKWRTVNAIYHCLAPWVEFNCQTNYQLQVVLLERIYLTLNTLVLFPITRNCYSNFPPVIRLREHSSQQALRPMKTPLTPKRKDVKKWQNFTSVCTHTMVRTNHPTQAPSTDSDLKNANIIPDLLGWLKLLLYCLLKCGLREPRCTPS